MSRKTSPDRPLNSSRIREAKASDADGIRRLLRRSWAAAYGAFAPPEDLRACLAEHYCTTRLREYVDDPQSRSLVAEDGGRIIGYLRLQASGDSPSAAGCGPGPARMYIRSIYVSPDRQGGGIGRALMRIALEHARKSGFTEIWLGVMRPNRRAYDWYVGQGFSPREEEPFTMGTTTVPCLICRKALTNRAFAAYDGFSGTPLSDLCLSLFSGQVEHWRRLRDAVRMLDLVVTKSFREKGCLLNVQCNPGRIASSTAAVGTAVAHRPCFLCRRHLPRSQKAILYRKDFLILCNPAPILLHHFTVASREHRPQAFFASAEDYLILCRDLGRRWDVLYNGPRCGASAPDHLHFQVIPSGILPLSAVAGGTNLGSAAGVSVSIFRSFGFGAIVLRGGNSSSLLKILGRLQDILPPEGSKGEEPMFNVLGGHNGRSWRLMIFPRRKHRPDIYYRPEKDRLLITPGAFEMSGLIVVPRKEDFPRLGKHALLRILREVALPPGRTLRIAQRLLSDGGER